MAEQSRFPNAMLDDVAKLAAGAAGLVKGAKDEAESAIRSRIDRFLADRDLVSREEFEAVRAMAAAAREENEKLAARVAALESKLSSPQG